LSAADPARASGRAAAALVFNAFVWGTSWWPLRRLQEAGLHPLWTTAIVFSLASIAIVAARPRAIAQVLRTPALWLLVAAAGLTNASFNWAIVIGDVVRVVLLFYLMPIWTVLLARVVLGERLTRAAALRVGLGALGAAIVLWPPADAAAGASGWPAMLPLPRSLADWLGVAGGFSFALNNVMLRREAARPEEGRSLAMFLGGAIVAGALAMLLTANGRVAAPPAPAWPWLALTLALTCVFLAGNLSLQYGAARLAANRTAVVMLTEVVFASLSALALGAGTLTLRSAVGGAFIVAGAVLAARGPARRYHGRDRSFAEDPMSKTAADIYAFDAESIAGQPAHFASQRGKVLLIVNTASKCGFTPQLAGLEALWQMYRDRGLVVIGFPSNQFGAQDPGSNDEIASFCETNYGVTFPMMSKVDVNGEAAPPLWKWLTAEAPGILGTRSIKWNFTKFLVGKDGKVIKRFAPNDTPESIKGDIENALAA
jgi:glutathione peroxidase-family protein/drug/metabolite transporter (DMT)-like permease